MPITKRNQLSLDETPYTGNDDALIKLIDDYMENATEAREYGRAVRAAMKKLKELVPAEMTALGQRIRAGAYVITGKAIKGTEKMTKTNDTYRLLIKEWDRPVTTHRMASSATKPAKTGRSKGKPRK